MSKRIRGGVKKFLSESKNLPKAAFIWLAITALGAVGGMLVIYWIVKVTTGG